MKNDRDFILDRMKNTIINHINYKNSNMYIRCIQKRLMLCQ